ncbi:P-loop containing nucleoside triphosphate hydrolase protein [Lipomyces tetrasporus]|uniref:RNA helicase n=1 Tax=Lipomyces tetrasporus TaxID=54092 RepID=A0AAD7VU27_9ASCO|nr:P-loop containing nucleoside triphosphate hydrolase protein [Lipomyces tetrasporus]KAJ8102682.1 P-loop containing nucleoside triphosphate hydrolase protein [Lipomyces tetrasporus]
MSDLQQTRKRKRGRKQSDSRGSAKHESINAKHSSILQKYRTISKSRNTAEVADASNFVLHSPEGEISTEQGENEVVDQPMPAGLAPLPQPPLKKKEVTITNQEWMVEPVYVKPTIQKPFSGLGLSERMTKNLASAGFDKAFAVQASVIPILISDINEISPDGKRPVLVNAATGSGKTLAYGIPIVEALSQRVIPQIRAVVIVPTRPLIQQVRGVIESLAKGTSLRVFSLRSERPFADEQAALQGSTPDILVTTPGRLVDHILSTQRFTLQHLRYLVIDEADRLLNQSFQDWVDVLMESLHEKVASYDSLIATRWSYNLQKLVFSATLTKDAGKWASLKIKQPRIIIVGDKSKSIPVDEEEFSVPFTLTEYMIGVFDTSTKPLLLHNLLRQEFISGHCVIFTRSNETAARLTRLLGILDKEMSTDQSTKPYEVGLVTGEIETSLRKRALKEFAEGKVDLIVCTDIIARGVDIESIQHVINYDIPITSREYVHRVGRTARAGKSGTAWSLVSRPEAKWFKTMTKKIRRSKDQKLINRAVTIWDGQEELYEKALNILEKQVKGME